MQHNALFWFTQDLRIQDNLALSALLMHCDAIAFVYVINPRDFQQHNYQHKSIGEHRFRCIGESLNDIDQQLQCIGHRLTVFQGEPADVLSKFATAHAITRIACANATGWFEQQALLRLKQQLPTVEFITRWNHSLFEPEQLSLQASSLRSFSTFRKQVESNKPEVTSPCKIWLETLPKALNISPEFTFKIETQLQKYLVKASAKTLFTGGEQAALKHVYDYFNSTAPSTYKETRNQLDGWSNSTKFSPYLALGNVSPRFIWQQLKRYELEHGSNESTYWIGFELLWREYFQWQALEKQTQLYAFQGSANKKPLTSYYGERFIKWCHGNTPYPLVNACMNELNATGFMSNRGRQIVASCLVNELSVDWRFGAAYFQQQLVDYDVASNWGNWQYIAGVGADPRGGRHFNLEKQTALHDPNGEFIKKWRGHKNCLALDSVDAADWPIMP